MSQEVIVDRTLANLVLTINSVDTRLSSGPGITLTVQGLIITGKVIPNWQWYEEVEQLCRDAYEQAGGSPDDPVGDGYALFFKSTRQAIDEARAEHAAMLTTVESLAPRFKQALFDVDRTQFIHLREAQAFPAGGASAMPTHGTHWRGKLADVSGWSFGQYVVTPAA